MSYCLICSRAQRALQQIIDNSTCILDILTSTLISFAGIKNKASTKFIKDPSTIFSAICPKVDVLILNIKIC